MIVAGVRPPTLLAQLPIIGAALAVTLLLILLIGSFYLGFMVRVMSRDPVMPAYTDPLLMFSNGIRYTIVYLFYFMVPMLVVLGTIVIAFWPIISFSETHTAAPQMQMILTLLAGLGFAFLLAIIMSVFWITGVVRFARTGSVPEAFRAGEILATIGRTGWGSYLIALCILGVSLIAFNIALFIVQTILGMIPLVGFVFVLMMLLIQIILGPFIAIFVHRYFSLVYDCAETA
jgi:hypothetical protein